MTHPATCSACQRVGDCVSIDGVLLCGECAGRVDDGAEREDAP